MRRLLSTLVLVAVITLSGALIVNRQDIIDWYRLRGYEPSAEIVRLSVNASFTDYGRRLFYIHDPQLLSREEFVGKCTKTEQTIVLGCYITNLRIYIFDVNDERLRGVEEVTAAHEMLHAAYDRLSRSERERIDNLTAEVFAASDDERLINTMEGYRKRDPAVVPTELHSILGTEIRELPEELEKHYQRYFLDRFTVVGLAEQYAQEFTQRQNRIREYDVQLKELSDIISSTEADLIQLEAALDVERAQLESLRGNPEAFNSRLPSYNDSVRDYNARLQGLRSSINRFNEIVAARNAIATEERSLIDALDSRPVLTQ